MFRYIQIGGLWLLLMATALANPASAQEADPAVLEEVQPLESDEYIEVAWGTIVRIPYASTCELRYTFARLVFHVDHTVDFQAPRSGVYCSTRTMLAIFEEDPLRYREISLDEALVIEGTPFTFGTVLNVPYGALMDLAYAEEGNTCFGVLDVRSPYFMYVNWQEVALSGGGNPTHKVIQFLPNSATVRAVPGEYGAYCLNGDLREVFRAHMAQTEPDVQVDDYTESGN